MTYQPLHHKYRPQSFSDLVGQEAIATTLTNALQQKRIAPAYLFTGARGTGKTSSARILAKSLNCVKSDVPTAQPCGVCDVCQSIAKGSALDVIEIDAASNTGVDNIRELIERSQFAPVQCRYKVYVVDECLVGDSLIWTDQGFFRIDDPTLLGKNVLSYNDALNQWEFKPVLRWLDQGIRQTYRIKTSTQEICCTGNHLIRTEQGWIAARDVKEGAKILSPANVDAAPSFINLGQTGAYVALSEGTSLRGTPTGKKATTSVPFLNTLNRFVRSACVDAVNGLKYLPSCDKRATVSTVFCPTGRTIRSNLNTAFGRQELKPLSPSWVAYHPTVWDLFTAPCWATAPLPIQTSTAAFQGYPGRTECFSESGWSTKQPVRQSYVPSCGSLPTKGLGTNQFVATQPAILSLSKCLHGLNLKEPRNEFLWTGSVALRLKGLPGGTWMMDRFASALKGVQAFTFIPKVTPRKRTSLSLAGLLQEDTQRKYKSTEVSAEAKITTLFRSGQRLLEGFWKSYSPTRSQQWHTNLEVVESVRFAGVEHVYDIEVEDNHNFVANGLLVHNCHMLSTAAFNALLKTLEEPPDRVVFVLATTDPQRVLPTIISRCQRFDFRRIPLEASVKHLRSIATKETIAITDDAITLIAQLSQGGMRDAESLLDQLSLVAGEVSVDKVWDLVGSVPERDLMSLLESIAQDNPETLLDSVRRLMDRGREPLIVLQNLASFYRDLLIAKTAPARNDLVALTAPTWATLCDFAQTLDLQTILAGQQQLRKSEDQIKSTTQPRLWLEVTLMGLLPSAIESREWGVGRQEAEGRRQRAEGNLAIAAGGRVSPSSQSEEPPQREPIAPIIPVEQPEAIAEPVDRSVEAALPDVTSQPDSGASSDLSQIWLEILSHIDLKGTRAMLSVNCHLLSQHDHEILVGVKAQSMLKMITGMIPQLEKAAAKTFKTKIKVSLQVAEATASAAPATQQPNAIAHSPSETHQRDRPTNPSLPDPNQKSKPEFPIAPTASGAQTNTNLQPPSMPKQPSSNHAIEAAANYHTADQWQQEDDVTRAAKQLAEFFGGRVVDMSDSDTVAEAPKLAEIDPASLKEKAAEALPETDYEPDEDDDVPF
ncbi:MAG: DNA polymerase III subunit gamma/tau [Lyngbya sp. HA4199-MV5]|jgi:DNA polymerase-3 subunit gamma/tau|nr:DNA polymerase III subunit gamma/tau [Lyngbya sp. HA4199-MV5]